MSEFTPNGIVISSQDEVFEALMAALESGPWGANAKRSLDSVTGYLMTIFAEAISDQAQLMQSIISAYQPNNAAGVYLSQLVLLNGITRNESAFTTVTLQVTSNTVGSTIPAGSLVSNPVTDEQFATDAEVILAPSSSDFVSATAVEAGPITAGIGTITRIDTPIYGWASVTNLSEAIPGRNKETDTQLRYRQKLSAFRVGGCSVAALHSALADLDNVAEVYIYANESELLDSYGIPPTTLWVIIRGGNDLDIAEAIFTVKGAGVGLFGNDSQIYSDPITGQDYEIKFERPTDRPIYITVRLAVDAYVYPDDGDSQIKQAIIDFFAGDFTLDGVQLEAYGLGKDIIRSRLFTPINTVPGHSIENLYLDFDPNPFDEEDLPIEIYQRGVVSESTIQITKV